MNKLIMIFLFCIVFMGLTAQENYESHLIYWLQDKMKDSVNFIRIKSLTGKFDYPIRNKKLQLNNGIYCFYNVVSHSTYYLFQFENKNLKIVEDYSVENILDIYWNNEKEIRKKKKKLQLIEGLTNIIYNRIRVHYFE